MNRSHLVFQAIKQYAHKYFLIADQDFDNNKPPASPAFNKQSTIIKVQQGFGKLCLYDRNVAGIKKKRGSFRGIRKASSASGR